MFHARWGFSALATGPLRLRARVLEFVRTLGHHDDLPIPTLALAHRCYVFAISKRHMDQTSISTIHRVERDGAARLKRSRCDPLREFSEKFLPGIRISFDVDHHALSIWTHLCGHLVDEQLERIDGPTLARGERLCGGSLHVQHNHLTLFAFGNLERAQLHPLDGSEQELTDLSELASCGTARGFPSRCCAPGLELR